MTVSRETIERRINDLPLHRRALLTWRLYRDPRVSPTLKRAIVFGALAYAVSPIDVIPDLFLGIGQVDDLGLLATLMFVLSSLLVKFAPDDVLASYLDGPTRGSTTNTRADRESWGDDDDIDVPFRVR